MKNSEEDEESIDDKRNDVGECRKRKRHFPFYNIWNIKMQKIKIAWSLSVFCDIYSYYIKYVLGIIQRVGAGAKHWLH